MVFIYLQVMSLQILEAKDKGKEEEEEEGIDNALFLI